MPAADHGRPGGCHSALLALARHDVAASVVVFLVAVPLCVGVAAASGVPAELSLVTGIVGGLLTGLLPGSSLQVSGPAAGLTVLVADAVHTYGLAALGPLVLAAGCSRSCWARCAAAAGSGRSRTVWSRACSQASASSSCSAAVRGGGHHRPRSALDRIGALPTLAAHAVAAPVAHVSLLLTVLVIAVMSLWLGLPGRTGAVPAALAAITLAVAVPLVFELPVATVEITSLPDAVHLPDLAAVTSLPAAGAVGTVLAIALVASAESLFGASAVDRLHEGPRTNKERRPVKRNAVSNANSPITSGAP
ncbi:SulP family inorganic anion transporter [Streptomyces vinaceus]|uniref:SulP family inorganic anion transporter n=1 Tax=Streptomyces vinaceus TaxID=1960 RepID=UPI003691B088